MHLISSH